MKFTDISPTFSGLLAKMTATGLDSSDELAAPSGLSFVDSVLRGIGQVHEWLIAAANAKFSRLFPMRNQTEIDRCGGWRA